MSAEDEAEDIIRLKLSPFGNEVIDDESHEDRRQNYYKRIEAQRGEDWMQFTNQAHLRNIGALNILNPRQVSGMYHVSVGTAYNWMRYQIIPSFRIGKHWFTHDYVLDSINEKAKQLEADEYNKRDFPRMVWRRDKGQEWR
jgi:hypothetical protein